MNKNIKNAIKKWIKDLDDHEDTKLLYEAEKIFEKIINETKKPQELTISQLNAKVNFYGDTWIVNTVCKEDLKKYLSDKQIEKLSDEDMSRIAEKLGNALMDCGYWDCLNGVIDYFKENKMFKS